MLSPRLAARLGLVAALALGAVLGASCNPPPPGNGCFNDPYCGTGGFGAFCDHDSECFDGFCCESDACNHGMCSYHCDNSDDCPFGYKCSGGACFVACDNDAQCAGGTDCDKGACKY